MGNNVAAAVSAYAHAGRRASTQPELAVGVDPILVKQYDVTALKAVQFRNGQCGAANQDRHVDIQRAKVRRCGTRR